MMELSHFNKTPLFNKFSIGKRKLAIILLSAFLGLLCIISLFLLSTLLNTSTIYHGVLLNGKNVGGYTKEKFASYLEDHYNRPFEDITLTIYSDRFERNVVVTDLGISIDIGTMTQRAYNIGRKGSLFHRLIQIGRLIRQPESIELELCYETNTFKNFLDQTCQAVYQEIIPPNIVIMEEQVILYTGISGQEADRERLKNEILGAVKTLKPQKITVPVIEKSPPSMDLETTLITLNQDPVNARFVKTTQTTYEIKTHQMGRRISREKLMEIDHYIESRENKEYEEISLPVEFISPEITEDTLEEQLFRDTLTTYTTTFKTNNENNRNRSINIGLAAESIDGTILEPGEEFSFNKIVGPRTSEKGYKIAHVFVDGQIRDGTGGGVCQVSTTLYNAVLRSNLPVSERHNHMFTVGYVPLGMDAAVSYGYADLVFKNTTGYPLLISAWVSENSRLTFKIRSKNDYPNLQVKLATKTINTTPPTAQYVIDYTLPQGTEVVSENGSTGYVVDTYMKIYNGEVLIREEKLHRSVYQMIPAKINRGTAPVAEMIE